MIGYVSNNAEHVTTTAGEFRMEQRNVGFADNDGQWIASQLPEHEYNHLGTLYRTRQGAFLGVFGTEELARKAIAGAAQLPECRIPLN